MLNLILWHLPARQASKSGLVYPSFVFYGRVEKPRTSLRLCQAWLILPLRDNSATLYVIKPGELAVFLELVVDMTFAKNALLLG